MKTGIKLAGIVILLLSGCLSVNAQTCVDALKTVQYDSLLTGAGNAFYNLSVPKFDGGLGTLTQVDIESEITLKYSFQLENKESIPINTYRVRVGRDDEISSSALMNPITWSSLKTYGFFPLAAADGTPNSGPDFVAQGPLFVANHSVQKETVYNTAEFLGAGNVNFDYISTTYSTVFGSVNYSFNANAADTMLFKVTYTYCPTWFLKADLTAFVAVKNSSQEIDLRWTTQNEESGREYQLQKSQDGRQFQTIHQIPSDPGLNATGNYRFKYHPAPNESGKLIFRLIQVEHSGENKYSPLRMVDLGNPKAGQVRIYPNPTHNVSTIVFHQTERSDWMVDVFSAMGKQVQHLEFRNALTARLNGNGQLPKGIYLLRIMNRKTQETQVQHFVVE